MASTKARSLVKALSWRTLSTVATTAFVWLMTGKASFAMGVLTFDVTFMTLLYYLHERAWKNINWGKYPTDWREYGWHKDDRPDNIEPKTQANHARDHMNKRHTHE